jgi:N-acyl-L-homoserine lactone synthetase
MIRIFTPADQPQHEELFQQMFRGRALIFAERLGWNVVVRDGLECDRYDSTASLVYIVATDPCGAVVGSLRLLPTIGETMLRNEFAKFFDDPPDVTRTTTWECTRFCVHPPLGDVSRHSAQSVSSRLLIGLCEFAMTNRIEHIMGLYEASMTRVYSRIGWSPQPLARARAEVGQLIVGLWDVSHAALETMKARAETRSGGVLPRGTGTLYKTSNLGHHQDVATLHA